MFKEKKPYEFLTTIGAFYEVTVIENVTFDGIKSTRTFQAELRGWDYDEPHDYLHAILWEDRASSGEEYYTEEIVAVKPIQKPLENGMFFNPYKGRTVTIGETVDVYRNLHTNNGYSIRSKKGIVLAHCSSVRLKNARFVVSESGRQKTVQERRKRVHAYVRGELVAYNEQLPESFTKVLYNPYYTEKFMDADTNAPITEAAEVFCSGKYAYAKKKNELDLFSYGETKHE
jgi:hypothetical protein